MKVWSYAIFGVLFGTAFLGGKFAISINILYGYIVLTSRNKNVHCSTICNNQNLKHFNLHQLAKFLNNFLFLSHFQTDKKWYLWYCKEKKITITVSSWPHCCCSVYLTLRPHELQLARFSRPSPSPWVCSNSSPLSQGCHPTISSSVPHFSSCPQSFPGSGSFSMNWLFTSGGQSIGASASAPVLPMNIQGWFPLGLTGLLSLLSKGLSRVFSSTTVQKRKFFSA